MWTQEYVELLSRAGQAAGLVHSHTFTGGLLGSGLLVLSRFPIVAAAFLPFTVHGMPLAREGEWLASESERVGGGGVGVACGAAGMGPGQPGNPLARGAGTTPCRMNTLPTPATALNGAPGTVASASRDSLPARARARAGKGMAHVRVALPGHPQLPSATLDVFNTHTHANWVHTYDEAPDGDLPGVKVPNDSFAPFRVAHFVEAASFIRSITACSTALGCIVGETRTRRLLCTLAWGARGLSTLCPPSLRCPHPLQRAGDCSPLVLPLPSRGKTQRATSTCPRTTSRWSSCGTWCPA